MAKWRIDRITALTSGGFPELRYADVYVDDNGIVTHQPVPGKKFIGNNELGTFKSYYREAAPSNNFGIAFTTFCNYTNFTLNRIYPTNVPPFAYNLPVLNEPSCGYLEPVPTPGVPYNPFGTPTYGDYAYYSFCDVDDNLLVEVKIRKKNYTGSVTQIKAGGKSPVIINRPTIDELDPIQKTEAKITFIQFENFQYSEFSSNDERMFQVEILKDGLTEFKGYVLPDKKQEPFDWPANEIQLVCTDGLTQLKQVTYPVPLGGTTAQRQSFKDILCYCLNPLNLNLNLSTIVNLYAYTNKTGLNDDPMQQNSINPLRLVDDKGTILKSYDVIALLAKSFRAVFVQDGGEWHFVRRKELIIGTSRRRIYDYQGVFLYAEQYDSPRTIGGSL